MKIPEHIVEQVRQQCDIVDVVGEVVQLWQRGQNYIGLCPFHNEKTPSFNVSPERGIFKCFGCGKGGNVFSFMMEYHKMGFVDAVKALADRAGVALPEQERGDDEEGGEHSRYDTAYALLRAAANFFYKNLSSQEGRIAADYIRRRGFRDDVVREFGLGYSLNQWQGLLDELRRQGFRDDTFLDAGLALERKDGSGLYDRFRGRLMFPIQNPMGRVIGFGARILVDEPGQPKYINSPQSLVYDKSKALYGIYQAKDAIRREGTALLVEGYADLLTLYEAGFRNVVASSGTALTREQLQLIGRYGKKVVIVYDGDFAGANAALRGLELALEEGFDVKIARLPEGDDPDSLVRSRGAQAMERVVSDAVSFVDFKGEMLKAQGLLGTPEGQAEAVRSIVETIARVPDHIRRDFMIRAVALRFDLNEHLLYGELSNILRRRTLSVRTTVQRPVENAAPDNRVGQTEKKEAPAAGRADGGVSGADLLAEERELFYIMLKEPRSIAYLRQRYGVASESFCSETGRRLCTAVFLVAEQYRDNLEQVLTNRAASDGDETARADADLLSGILLQREMPSRRWKDFGVSLEEDYRKIAEDCLARLQISSRERELRAIEQRLQQRGADDEPELLREYTRIRAEIDAIRDNGLQTA